MKLDQTFTVKADPDAVWRALTDVMRVAPNLPGAAITEDAGDGSFKGEFKVKIGPTTAAYNGAMKIEHLDEELREATMSARGTDKRGNGGATATIVSRVRADPEAGGTRVDVETDFSITGKLARFGRGGMIQDVSNRLLREFAANLQEDLAGGDEPAVDAAPVASGSDASVPPAAGTSAAPEAPAPAGAPVADAPDAAGTPGPPDAASPRTAPPPPRPAPPPRREPAPPVGGIGLVLGVARDRLSAAAVPLAVGFVLGVVGARTFEIRRRT